jgi:hypothetical protein
LTAIQIDEEIEEVGGPHDFLILDRLRIAASRQSDITFPPLL